MSEQCVIWKVLAGILTGILAILLIDRIFKNDSGSIVSSEGEEVLKNDDLMEKFKKQLDGVEEGENSNSVIVNLD